MGTSNNCFGLNTLDIHFFCDLLVFTDFNAPNLLILWLDIGSTGNAKKLFHHPNPTALKAEAASKQI